MSRNDLMHPRNIYKTLPDFTDLAINYADFRKMCTLKLNGKVEIDLKKTGALEQLTKTLLLKDFQLKVEFPENCLIPTIPLRLNYILWLEDLIKEFKLDNIEGIDIGCGAAAIYSILGARKNNWKMVGLELKLENVNYAILNIKNNNLENDVSIFQQKKSNIVFHELFDLEKNQHKQFTFCLCNPPFYEDESSLPENKHYSKRRRPNNKATGGIDERTCDGGEVAFINQIIEESLHFKNKILIYSTMIGIKKNVYFILNALKHHNITNIIQTQFCQGHVTRWCIAWSFAAQLNLNSSSHLSIGNSIRAN